MKKHVLLPSIISILSIMVLFSLTAGAAEKTIFPDSIFVQKSYNGLIKVVENQNAEKSVTQVQTGDLNGDGFEDAIIGSFYSDEADLSDAGAVYVIFGNQEFFDANPVDVTSSQYVLTIYGNEEYDNLGHSLATGDINGDGIDDLVFCASTCMVTNLPGLGNAYVLLGSPELSAVGAIDLANPGPEIIPVTGDDEIGVSAALGDVDGDGFDDIIIGSAVTDSTGVAYIIKGAAYFRQLGSIDLSGDFPPVIKIAGENSTDYFGAGVASGDLNGDGFCEVIIGARHADTAFRENCGKTYIIWGFSEFFMQESPVYTGSMGQNVTVLIGADELDYSGTIIETGDLNSDAYADLFMESSRHNPGNRPFAGVVYILKGNPQLPGMNEIDLGSSYDNLIKIYGRDEFDLLGRCVPSDIDGDGNTDLVLASQGENETGEVYLLTDDTLWSQNELDLRDVSSGMTTIYANQPSGILGYEIRAGDFNGDQKNDVLIGTADLIWSSLFTDGIVYVMSGAGVTEIPYEPFQVHATDTGSSSTIVILDEHPPYVDGIPLNHGSEIGVFTGSGICAGLGIWTGDDLEITVWGDNTDTNDIEGFLPGGQYYFRVRDSVSDAVYDNGLAVFYTGDGTFHDDEIVVLSTLQYGIVTDIADAAQSPFSLDQNYPNPFNPVTSIPFTLSESEHVVLTVYDIRGGKIETLADNDFSPGTHAVEWNAQEYPSGVYLYRLETGSSVQARKMLLIK